MDSSGLNGMLTDSAAEVLEKMFFTSFLGEAPPTGFPNGTWLSARLTFNGKPPGSFGVRTPPETGRKIAANFLGLEEGAITESQTAEVICELANMLCGSMLSRIEKDTRFELSHPELDAPETAAPVGATASQVLELEEGPLAVWLEFAKAL